MSLPESLTLTLMRLSGKTAILKFLFLIKRRSFPHSVRPAKQNLPRLHPVHSKTKLQWDRHAGEKKRQERQRRPLGLVLKSLMFTPHSPL